MKSKKLWLRLITVILIFATVITLSACAAGSEGESGSGSDSNFDGAGVRAEDLASSQNLTMSLTSNRKGYQVKDATKCKDEQIVIPATYTGTDGVTLPVTQIATNAFKNHKTVVSVYIPDSVTRILSNAFKGAKSLTTLVCGSGLTEIGNNAFENCKALKNIVLREGITKIGPYAFAGCEHLETMVIPNSVKTIGEACFMRCARMTSIVLGSGIVSQDTVENGKVTKRVEEIGKFAFYFCKNISTIRYAGTKEAFEALHIDVSCFLSTTLTDDVICADGQTAKLPELEGQLELPKELEDSFD